LQKEEEEVAETDRKKQETDRSCKKSLKKSFTGLKRSETMKNFIKKPIARQKTIGHSHKDLISNLKKKVESTTTLSSSFDKDLLKSLSFSNSNAHKMA
jgi:predicted outer membrane protein